VAEILTSSTADFVNLQGNGHKMGPLKRMTYLCHVCNKY